MGIIAKNLPRVIYHDCEKEANDIVNEIPNFGRICNQITMKIVRELLDKQ